MNARQALGLVLAASATLGLGACGGGDASSTDSPSATVQEAPPDALSRALSIIESQKGSQNSGDIDPLTLQKQLAPLDDTIEPTPIG